MAPALPARRRRAAPPMAPRRRNRDAFYDARKGGYGWRPKKAVGPAVADPSCKTEDSEKDDASSMAHSILGDSITICSNGQDDQDDHRSGGGSEDKPNQAFVRFADVRGDTVPAPESLRSSPSGAASSRKPNEGNVTCMLGTGARFHRRAPH